MLTGSSNLLKFIISGDSSQLQREVEKAQRTVTGFTDSAVDGSARMRTVTGQMDGMTMSVKQLNAATRGLPAQFTDIFVSLQGGQAPMTVLFQQGGQLKDMFGGIGPAAKAMGGYIMGLVNPYSLAAAAVIALGVAYYQGSAEQDAWNQTLATTGNAVGVTTSELRSYAQQLDGVVGTQRSAAAGLNDMLAAGVAGGNQLRDYTQAAMAWESATGQAVGETAKQFKSLANEPLQAVLKLNEGTNFLTLDVYQQIKALQEQSQTTEATRVAQDAYAQTLNERSAQIKDNLGSLEKAWAGVKGWAAQAWDAMLNIGRASTVDEQLVAAREKLDKLTSETVGVYERGTHAARVTRMREVVAGLEAESAAQALNAAASEHSAKTVAAQSQWDQVVISNLDKKAKMERELASVRQKAAAAGASDAELEVQLAAVREKYVEKTKKASAATENAYKTLSIAIAEKQAAVDKEIKQGEKLTEYEKLRLRYQQDLVTRGREYSVTQRAKIEADLAVLEISEKQELAERALAKAWEEDAKALEKLQRQRESQLSTLTSNLNKLLLEEEAHQLAAASGITHAEAVERLTIARLEEHLVMARQGTESLATVDWLERELAVRQQIAQAMGQKGVREANEKAAKEAAKDWEKTSQTIRQTLQDYIMGGGKDAAEYLKRLFSTLVLQPVVKTVVGSVLGMGGSGESGSAGQAGSLLSGAQNISSIYSAFTGGITSTMAGGIASLGSAFGSSALTSFAAGMKGSTLAAGLAGPTTAGASGAMGLGATVGAALPWVAGGLAVVSLLGGLFGSNPKEHTGGVYSNATDDRGSVLDTLNLTKHARGDFTSRQNEGVDTALATTIDGLLESYAGFAKRATGDVRDLSVYAAFATNPISKDQDAYGYMRVIDKLTGDIVAQASRRDGDGLGNDPEKAYSLFTGEIAGVLVKELKAADLPGWMHSLFDSLGESVTLESYSAAVQQIALIDAGFLSLGKTMGMFADLSGQMQTSLLGVFGSIDNLTATASTFYNSYYSEAQRMETLAAQVQSALSGLSVQIDPRMGDIAKAQFKEAVEAAFAAGKGELGAQLLAMNQQFATAAEYAAKAAKDMQQAALAMAQSAVDGAFANFEAAVERERTYWDGIANAAQDAVGKLSSTLSLLTSNAQALYGTVDSTQQMLAAQGMVYIEDALAGVLGGASASSYSGLQDAITAARGGISNGAYATQFDRDRDTLVLAGQLSQLGELTDSQLSIEERALKAANAQIEQLDKTLEYWQQALDFDAQGIDATLTVAQAVMALGPLISALQLERAGGSYAAAIKAVTPGGEGPKAALYQQMLGSGLTDAQIRAMVDKTTGVQTDSDWDYLKKLAVPGYDVGANYIPNDQLAVLHRGEAVIPEAFNPWAGGVGWGMDMSRMEALMERLLDDNRRQAGEIIRLNARVARLLERWEGGGLPRQREEEAA